MTTKLKLEDCTVYLDASYDLHQASSSHESEFAAHRGIADEQDAWQAFCDDFEAAYRGAAKAIAEKIGVQIRIKNPPCSQYGGIDGNVESEGWASDCDLWQCLHDLMIWDAEDAEWVYSEEAVAKAADAILRDYGNDE